MTIVTHEEREEFKETNTRDVLLPDNTTRPVRLTPAMWEWKEAIQTVEGLTEKDLSAYALEEEELQDVSFDRAYRCVVAYLIDRWQ